MPQLPCDPESCAGLKILQLRLTQEVGDLIHSSLRPLYEAQEDLRLKALDLAQTIQHATERLGAMDQALRHLDRECDDLRLWREAHDGREAGIREEARKAGRLAGMVYGGLGALVSLLSFLARYLP
ncbi:hypothetical protein G3N55_00030 [Dissulfurirhabdus thermomarina]|uniref:Uncharacterized protein n=1 Tax=Dissulfurirhabdus thermomarina TaxID=1765737 RepID=A0A6N9TP75_DISTH|nr:hypothetical protein [Dissulfurirhabdus thermomarina]NDY41237.1 hypothetical protein [Dissulfurirhabdus thermomarina]